MLESLALKFRLLSNAGEKTAGTDLHRGIQAGAARAFEHGVRLFSQRDVAAAIQAFQLAESRGYDVDFCASYRWQCAMLLGNFQQAWCESDRIAARGKPDPFTLWDRSPFEGKRVLIRCLHGYGDAIQFLRYGARIRQTASRLIVETHPEMVSLVERLPFVDEVTTWAPARSVRRIDWDQQLEVMELPYAFRSTITTIPDGVPYLDVTPEAKRRSARNLGHSHDGNRKKIGLLWASSMWNPARSISLAALLPVLNVPGCAFYSFQRGQQREELAILSRTYQIHDTAGHSPEIVDTAADLTNMDLLITVDTMAAHLSGALGKKVWTLLPFEADWRWMLHRRDTPWYPSMRLFRQCSPGDWQSAIGEVANELARFEL